MSLAPQAPVAATKPKRATKPKADVAPADQAAAPVEAAVKKTRATKPKAVVEDSKESKEAKAPRARKLLDYSEDVHSGINLNITRVKHAIDDDGLNMDIANSIAEIRAAREAKQPLSSVSPAVSEWINKAKAEHVKKERQAFDRDALAALHKSDPAAHAAYVAARRAAKLAARVAGDEFDSQAFNLSQNKAFYKAFVPQGLPVGFDRFRDGREPEAWDEYKRAIHALGKIKNRFSVRTKLYVAIFVERAIQELLGGGVHACIDSGKKLVQFAHLAPNALISSLTCFAKHAAAESAKKTEVAAAEALINAEAAEVDGEGDKKFKLYVEKIFAYCKSPDMNGQSDAYNSASLSAPLKKLCNDIIVELIERFNSMMAEELANGASTITDQTALTLGHHMYAACGLDFEPMRDYIKSHVERYVKFQAANKATKVAAAPVGTKPKKVEQKTAEPKETKTAEPKEAKSKETKSKKGAK